MKVLVYGWYHQDNIGDDLFVEAYQHLFPQLQFTFTEVITSEKLQQVDIVFFGGGSFLLDRPRIDDDALVLLETKKIFYIGVGVEGAIHPIHLQLMSQALLVAIRSPDKIKSMKDINSNVMLIPDLVYSLQDKVVRSIPDSKSVLFLSNVSVLPHITNPHWKHAAWEYFKSECSQFFDWLVNNGYQIKLFSMCRSDKLDDDWVSNELISHMENRDRNHLLQDRPHSIQDITKLFSQFDTVITQRFHGIVLSEMSGVPYVAIHHHDKLKPSQSNQGQFLSYYNVSKHVLIESFQQAKQNNNHILPIKYDLFKALVEEV